jgi:AraC family transcriptional regulator
LLSDSDMLRSADGILSRLSRTGMSVVASSRALGWRNIHGVITEGRLEDFFDYSAPFHIVAFNLKGAPMLEWKRGTRFSRFRAQPGELLITPSGEGNSIRQPYPNVAFSCGLSPDLLQSLAEQEWNAHGSTIEIFEAFSRDAELWTLGHRLAAQLRSPIPGSRLFAETLVTQIAIKLLWNYSSLSGPIHTPAEKLTDPRLRRVIDYLHGSFAEEISLDGLAQVAGLSPNYFLHAFRQSTGRTPHRYLTELRIARACELLQDPYQSIVDISLSVGFSSQSHLTTVFRRFMKTTPAAYRQEVLGLHPQAEGQPPHSRNPGPQARPPREADPPDRLRIVRIERPPK